MKENNILDVETQEKEISTLEAALNKDPFFAPSVDVFETEDKFVLLANMPGVSKENVTIKFEDGSLMIAGTIDYETALNRKYILNETEIGHYLRKFKLSDGIDVDKIEASLENGQLWVDLPKHERTKPKTIEIR